MDENSKTLVLRCNKYPKKGSREWIVDEDSIVFKVLGKEERDKVSPIANITSVKLSMSSDTLCLLSLEISGDRKEFQMIVIDDVDATFFHLYCHYDCRMWLYSVIQNSIMS